MPHQLPEAQIPQSHHHRRRSGLTSTVERRCWSPLWINYSGIHRLCSSAGFVHPCGGDCEFQGRPPVGDWS
jgi:hypothetical protein